MNSAAAWRLKKEEEPDFSLMWLPPSPPLCQLSPVSHQPAVIHTPACLCCCRVQDGLLFIFAANSFHLHNFVLPNGRQKSSSSISILLWRVHPLALHLIALSAWPRNRGRVGEASTSSTASHLSSSPQGTAAALAHWLLGNVPVLLCTIDQV